MSTSNRVVAAGVLTTCAAAGVLVHYGFALTGLVWALSLMVLKHRDAQLPGNSGE